MGKMVKATAGVLLALSVGTGLATPTAFPATTNASAHSGSGVQSSSLVNQTGCDDDGGPDTENELTEGGQECHSSGS
jgi:hypothetical protein